MKLDKYKFARLIGIITNIAGRTMDGDEIDVIDHVCHFDAPNPVASYPDAHDINALMALMAEGNKKIDAIKLHRKLTGYGLKESKEAVEKYWPVQSYSPDNIDALRLKRIADALGTEETGEALIEVARNAHKAELELASQHNEEQLDPQFKADLGDILSSVVRR